MKCVIFPVGLACSSHSFAHVRSLKASHDNLNPSNVIQFSDGAPGYLHNQSLSIKHAAHGSALMAHVPFFEQHHDFLSRVFDDAVHLDVVLVVAKGIFKLHTNTLNAVECEGDDSDDGDTPPSVVVDDGEW